MQKRILGWFRLFALSLVLAVLVVSCGGGGDASNLVKAKPIQAVSMSLEQAQSDVESVTAPEANPVVLEQLKAALKQALAETGKEKFTSAPPRQDGSECGLAWDAETGVFRWRYFSVGDYDQNSEVGSPDLAPLASYFGETGLFQLYGRHALTDGDLNGELGSADIVPIASNYLAICSGYGLYMSTSEADYPTTNDAPNGVGATEVAVIPFSAAMGDSSVERLWFEYTPDAAPTPGTYYWVRPLDGSGNQGTPSNLYEFPDVPGNYTLEYNSYSYDSFNRLERLDYSVCIGFEGQSDVRYFNLAIDDEWVVQNVPLISYEGEGEYQEVLMGFNLGEEAELLTQVHAAASINDAPIQTAPKLPMRMPLFERDVVMTSGITDTTVAPIHAAMENEVGGEVEDWAGHGSPFPNQECGDMECVPAAVSNSLAWLNSTYGTPSNDKPTDIGTMKDATGWTTSGCGEDWPQTKANYMTTNGYGINTDEYPDPLDLDNEVDAADCQAALEALREGKDVEMTGNGHAAAVVGMARLDDGRYVIYVSHDTKQGADGGTEVEKIIYDPSADPPVAEGGAWFSGGSINGFTVEYPDQLLFDLVLEQVDYTLDGVTQQDSEFLSIEITYMHETTPKYFNMTLNGDWFVRNVPLVAPARPDLMGYPSTASRVRMVNGTGIASGLELGNAAVGTSIDDAPRTEPPSGSANYPVSNRSVNMGHGRGSEAIDPGDPQTEFGGEVVDYAYHDSTFPNNDCGENECVLAGVSNSLEWLRNEYGSPPVGKEIDIDHWKPILDWLPDDGTAEGWASRKSEYMRTNGYGVSTEGYPPNDDQDHAATADECDQALQAIKDGKDVEVNGESHCAAVVGMAKLANGSYVMYVAHDTDQGTEGGQCIEKIIYDPNADPPVAEGAWGFNGGLINGFVAEWVETGPEVNATFTQTDFLLEGVSTENSEWAELEITYDADSGNGTQYLNLSIGGEWIMQNVPIRDPDDGGEVTLIVPFSINGEPEIGEQWVESFFDVYVTPDLQSHGPDGDYLCTIGDGQYTMDSGETGTTLTYSGPTTDPLWWINSSYSDAAFHPWSAIVNQDCGNGECAPAAVSNSMKMLKAANPTEMGGLSDTDVGIGTMRGATNWNAGPPPGAPAGAPDSDSAWWNKKDEWMRSHDDYPINTEVVKDKADMDDIIQAIRDGKDVELRIPGHVVMVTGCVKLSDGTYVLEVAHDTNQGTEGGTVVELVKFDPDTGKFSGRSWINGVDFTNGTTNGAMFVVENVSTLNLEQTDYNLNGVTTTDSGWGEVTINHTQDGTDVEFFNLSVNGHWAVQNLPLPVITPGNSQEVTARYALNVPSGVSLTNATYGWSVGTTIAVNPPDEIEQGVVSSDEFNMSDGDTGGTMVYQSPGDDVNWSWDPLPDYAFHDSESIVNQECGENECAPAAVSNSLQMLQNLNPSAMGGLTSGDLGIPAMKPVTDWDSDGAPAGGTSNPGSWWNQKKWSMWIDPRYPINTEINSDPSTFGDVIDEIRDGNDVELRIPGHVVMVTGAMELPNGDYILWVAHDTDQGKDGGTVVEPVYYDSATGRFRGPEWIDGVVFGGDEAIFVVESVDTTSLDLTFDLPTPGMGTLGDPLWGISQMPQYITVMHSEMGDVTEHADTLITIDPPSAGDVYGDVLIIDPAFSGVLSISATYNERPALPDKLYIESKYTPPFNSLFCWPSTEFAEAGDDVVITVLANETANPFLLLQGCRVVMPMGNTYVADSFNVGMFGGTRLAVDGLWHESVGITTFLVPEEAAIVPVELALDTIAYDFFIYPDTGSNIPLATGALFNFKVDVQTDLILSFQEEDGMANKTFYSDDLGAPRFWGDISNGGTPPVTLLP